MRTIIIGDCHGDHRNLLAILRETGAIDAHDQRLPETRVIQLGDLIHGGATHGRADDATALKLGIDYCDEILIGNHELPHLYPSAGFPKFGGMQPPTGRVSWLLRHALDLGKFVPATSVGDWLLTHAGVFPGDLHGYDKASQVVTWLQHSFRRRLLSQRADLTFDAVGKRRGGRDLHGGIFWLDWQELMMCTVINPIKQIVGHTPQGDAPTFAGYVWCVDVGAALSGRMAALVSDDDGATWTPMVVSADASADAA